MAASDTTALDEQLAAEGYYQPPPPPPQEEMGFWPTAAAVVAQYGATQLELESQVMQNVLRGAVPTVRSRSLAQRAATMQLRTLGRTTDPMVDRVVQEAFNESARQTFDVLKPVVGGSHEGPPMTDAAKAMSDALKGRLEDARRYIGRRVNDVYRKAGTRAVLESLIGLHGSPQEAQKRLLQLLNEQGIYGFQDRLGRQWQLDRYAEMVIRTTMTEAVTEGFLNTMALGKMDLMRIVEHPDACRICRPWQDRLISISGERTHALGRDVYPLRDYPGGLGPPAHPNCRCVAAPVVESLEALA